MPKDHSRPSVFVSSTSEDLEEFRVAVKETLLGNDCFPVMFEYWEGADNPPLKECLARIDDCDLVLVLVAKRHGWTPADQTGGEGKSVTRLECEHALTNGIDIIPHLLDDAAVWPVEKTEDYRLTVAAQQGKTDGIADLADEIQRNKLALVAFKEWLSEGRQRRSFSTTDQLSREITTALIRWRLDHPEFQPAHAASGFDRMAYRDWLRRRCESVELLGLEQRDAHNVRLQHVYVPAMVGWNRPPAEYWKELNIVPTDPTDKLHRNEDRIDLPLIRRLGYQSLYVPGAPGAGKSTFCRWLALISANGSVPQHPIPAPEEYDELLLPALQERIPVLCYLRDLNDHRDLLYGSGHWTRKLLEDAFAHWLDRTQPGGLNGSSWRALIDSGECLMILDGVDELQTLYRKGGQSHLPRANFLSGLGDALPYWLQRNNRVLLTSRPYGLSSPDQQKLGLATTELQVLETPLQHTFIRRWFAAVDPPRAKEKSEGLIEHLEKRDDLRELRESPMLLTALCVKYDEGRRLPRDIHILYHSVINQVLHGRYHDTTEQQAVRRRLAAVALGMHTGGAIGQIRSTPEAAVVYLELERILADYAGEEPASEGGASNATEKREALISRSGLLLPRGEEQAGFYHLSFQEYLAAERLEVSRTDFSISLREHAATAEWRRTLMFLFCAVADTRPQVALDAVRDVLLPGLEVEALRQNPNLGLLLLDCLEIAYARRWTVTDFTEPLWTACQQSLGSDLSPEIRNLLWLAAGKLGIDRRPGIGVDDTGLPDIAWCPVPAGPVKLEDDAGQMDVAACSIARYPVTNRQFQAFIDAEDGYRSPGWWDPEWLEAGWVDPETSQSSHWTEANAPRESVSWHEAVAFCRWLDHRLRKQGRLDTGQQLRLPTEWEWQQAATGGDPRRTYPWGPEWEPERLNAEMTIGRTTVVGLYSGGQSSCGALDMSGNVFEWCLNKYNKVDDLATEGEVRRVLRGGAFGNDRSYVRAAYRNSADPADRNYDLGFRVSCELSLIVNSDR